MFRRVALLVTIGISIWGSSLVSLAADNANGGTMGMSLWLPRGERPNAGRYSDVVIGGASQAQDGVYSDWYDENPQVKVLVYQNWYDSGPPNSFVLPDYNYVNSHENWFYHDADGNRIATYKTANKSDCDPQQCRTSGTNCNCRWAVNLGNQELRNYVRTRSADIVTTGGDWGTSRGADGIYLDNTASTWYFRDARLSSGHVSGRPVYPGGVEQTEEMYVADVKGFLGAIKAGIGPNKLLLFNGCFSFHDQSRANALEFLENSDGCSEEYWVVSCGGGGSCSPELGDDWLNSIEFHNQVRQLGQNKWMMPLLGLDEDTSRNIRYGVASALLVWQGDHSMVSWWRSLWSEPGSTVSPSQFASTYPELLIDLGTPLAPHTTQSNGLATRAFSRGLVVVNPRTSAKSMTLPGEYRTVDGTVVSGSFTLQSGRAEILLSTGGTTGDGSGPPPPDDVWRTDKDESD